MYILVLVMSSITKNKYNNENKYILHNHSKVQVSNTQRIQIQLS